jgi:hypothetical protein
MLAPVEKRKWSAPGNGIHHERRGVDGLHVDLIGEGEAHPAFDMLPQGARSRAMHVDHRRPVVRPGQAHVGVDMAWKVYSGLKSWVVV